MPIFKRTFSQDLDLLEQHLTEDILSRTDCRTTLTDLRTKFENAFHSKFEEHGSMEPFGWYNNEFQKFINSKFTLDYDSQMTDTYFVKYTGIEVQHFRDTLLQHLGNVKKFIAERTRHQRQYKRRVNKRQMQTQESKIDTWSGNDTDAVDARYQDHYDEEQWMRVDQYPKQCQVKSPMLDSSPGWIPTGKLSDSCTSKVDSEPPHGSM
ncbi:hypothetical protein Tco_1183611 [Tanacetum coccineum]